MIKIIKPYISGLIALFYYYSARIPAHTVRRLIFRLAGMKIGRRVALYSRAEVRAPRKICIGDYTSIGHDAILDGRCGITIGANVNFSSGVWIWTMQHDQDSVDFGLKGGAVVIHDYAWIGGRVVILPGVTIGRGAVVASGAVVTKSVGDYQIVGGVPAKFIRMRRNDLNYTITAPVPFI